MLGEFGYNCHIGNCYLIPNEDNYMGVSPSFILDCIVLSFVILIIVFSYGYIWFRMWRDYRFLKRNGVRYAGSKHKVGLIIV